MFDPPDESALGLRHDTDVTRMLRFGDGRRGPTETHATYPQKKRACANELWNCAQPVTFHWRAHERS